MLSREKLWKLSSAARANGWTFDQQDLPSDIIDAQVFPDAAKDQGARLPQGSEHERLGGLGRQQGFAAAERGVDGSGHRQPQGRGQAPAALAGILQYGHQASPRGEAPGGRRGMGHQSPRCLRQRPGHRLANPTVLVPLDLPPDRHQAGTAQLRQLLENGPWQGLGDAVTPPPSG